MNLFSLVRGFFLALTFFVSSIGWANTVVVTKNVTGTGATEVDAINNGLRNAIIQVNGAELASSTREKVSNTGAKIRNDNEQVLSQQLSFEKASETELKAQGLIDGYELLNSYQSEGAWKAELQVRVFRYELELSSQRKKIALLPVINNSASTPAGKKLAKNLENAIESELVQTRRFAVLSRTNIDKVITEQNFINSDDVHKAERAKLGNLLGGDVILSISIEKGFISNKETEDRLTGQVMKETMGLITLNLKAISAVTGEIKFSESYSSHYGGKIISLDLMVKDVAAKAVKDLSSRIYPPLVVNANNSEVVINLGGKGVKVGSVYKVYSKGETILDPYTGESLGAVETEIGSVLITRVESKFSVATIVSGGAFAPGMVVRSVSENSVDQSSKQNENATIPIDRPVSGVKLPFDR